MYFRDTVIYLIHIDLMRKCCQLINVDVDVDANESSRQLVEDGITTRTWLVDSPGGEGGYCHIWAIRANPVRLNFSQLVYGGF